MSTFVQYRAKLNPSQWWKDGFREIMKRVGSGVIKYDSPLSGIKRQYQLGKIFDLTRDSWRIETDEEKELRMRHPDLAVVLYNFYVCSEILRQVKEPKAFGEIVNFLEQLISRPIEYFHEPEHKLLMGNYLTNLRLPQQMVSYYTYLLGHMGARSCRQDTFSNIVNDGAAILLFTIRNLLWTCADMNVKFAASLAETDYLAYLAVELQELSPRIPEIKETNFTLLSNLTTLYTLSKMASNRKHFRNHNVASCLIPYLKSPAVALKLLALLTLSDIIDDNDNHLLLKDDAIFDFFLGTLKASLEKPGEITNGFLTTELLDALFALARLDENKTVLSRKGVIPLLRNILQTGSVEEQKSCMKLIWQLGFDPDSKVMLQDENGLTETMITILETSESHELRHLTLGALWVMGKQPMTKPIAEGTAGRSVTSAFVTSLNVYLTGNANKKTDEISKCETSQSQTSEVKNMSGVGAKDTIPASKELSTESVNKDSVTPSTGTAGTNKDISPICANKDEDEATTEYVMLSYNWDDQITVLKIRDYLRSEGYNVWMDVDNLEGSTLEAMAQAVENASVVLLCISESYKESLSSRTEAEYASRQGKDMVPLQLEDGYRPDGWLGKMIGSNTDFSFTPTCSFEDNMKELMSELGDRGKTKADADSPDRCDAFELKKWTKKDIAKWLREHELYTNKSLKRLAAEDINFLRVLYHKCPDFFFNYCKKEFGVSRLSDMRKLNDAILALP